MKCFFTLFLFLFIMTTAICQPGSLDKSFADTGVFFSQTFTGISHDVLVQKDGKIVSIGEGSYGTKGGFLVVRLNEDGTPDLSFGDSGRVITSLSPYSAIGLYGALQEDGKIVMTGNVVYLEGGYGELVVIRYLPDGTIDSSFGVNGVAGESISNRGIQANGVAVQPDGKIVVGGSTADIGEIPTFFLLRYNRDGSPDLSFGTKGTYQEEIDDVISSGGFTLQPDGKLLLAGVNYTVTGVPIFVRRYTSEGKPDKEFGKNGEARFYPDNGDDGGAEPGSIAVREDGKIVCGGRTYYEGLRYSLYLVQFNADGSVD